MAFATKYDILPTANDPLYIFNVSTPVNNQEAKIHGFEFGGQYFFGDIVALASWPTTRSSMATLATT